MNRRSLVCWFVGGFFVALAGCASPTLPLPPPSAPDGLSVDAATGEWTIEGTCIKGALVTVFNEETGEGSVVEDRDQDGRYSVKLRATKCDLAWVQQGLGQDISAFTTFVVAEKVNGSPADPQACK